MKFNSEVYNKVYHSAETDSVNAGSAGGVVEPQPKQNENADSVTDVPKQTTTDININVNVTPAEAETPGEIDDATDDNAGESEVDDGANS